ncbi:MAG TPA: tetratricopeptide repeat protein, partial [Pseudolabrys sp.]|nr:tetratricopeptide repeat protein [Pseudolabrys sp.]
RVHNLLGKAFDRLGKPLDAIKAYDAAIALDPDFAEAHGNRASIVAQAGFPDEALKSFDRALALDPTAVADWINRGVLLHELGRFEEALADYDKALTLAPEDPSILTNRANALVQLGHFDEGITDYDRALKRNPRLGQALAQKGTALKLLGRFDEARKVLEQSRALDAKDGSAALALAELLLLTGNWRAAWPLYEARASRPELPDAPRWQGEKPGDFRLVLVAEGRPADTVLFGRYAALLAGRGYDVTLLAPPALAPLMRSLPRVEQVVDDPAALKQDKRRMVWFPLQSVMGILPLTPMTVPEQGAYLTADAERVATWAQRLAGEELKVGIAWGDTFGSGAAPLAALAPLAAADGRRFVALQTGTMAEAAATTFGAQIEHPLGNAPANAQALLDLAAVIANVDVVVSTDALPAYIAAAMGKSVMLALPPVPDWRWLLDRADSPWFPTMRLFRQKERGEWSPVFADIADALHAREA